MIEALTDLPDGVTGIRVSGTLTGDEMRAFRPTMLTLLDAEEIRFIEVVDSDYRGFGRGGLMQDIKEGFGVVFTHHRNFKRMAILTDKDWIVHTLHALAWMVPGELEIFGLDELERATAWVSA